MANKQKLREIRTGSTIDNAVEKRLEKAHYALREVLNYIHKRFPTLMISCEKKLYLKPLVNSLKDKFSHVDFHCSFDTSFMRPDSGIVCLNDRLGMKYPVLITEMKNQGTNDSREKEGKKKQAKGNAIERLGKNVIGFRMLLLTEDIFPFICFGDGCDFATNSSILDRVSIIAMFGELNKIHLFNEGPHGVFNRGSFFFREKLWTAKEMAKIMKEICEQAINYYLKKYGIDHFKRLC